MGAIHRLVLCGTAPRLAAYYPSVGGTVRPDGLWEAFLATVEDQSQAVADLATQSVQTNEVGRSRALVGGFFAAIQSGRLPLRLLEIGASAGLNLRWDRYGYRWRDRTWGNLQSPVQFREEHVRAPAIPEQDPVVIGRYGCDIAPIDAGSDEGRLSLLSFVWADQIERIERLEHALQVARGLPVEVECRRAGAWLKDRLSESTPGAMTVVFHSIVMPYLSDDERCEIEETIKVAGAGATSRRPFAWLRMEAASRHAPHATVSITTWPGEIETHLATTGFHGQNVEWTSDF